MYLGRGGRDRARSLLLRDRARRDVVEPQVRDDRRVEDEEDTQSQRDEAVARLHRRLGRRRRGQSMSLALIRPLNSNTGGRRRFLRLQRSIIPGRRALCDGETHKPSRLARVFSIHAILMSILCTMYHTT